jgi:DnaK suppressor protein
MPDRLSAAGQSLRPPLFVSILQLMGFPLAKPLHSRAEEKPDGGPDQGELHVQAHSARRKDVKSTAGQPKAVAKKPAASVKAKPSPAPVAKSAPKTPVKPAPKVAVKTPAKPSPGKAAPAKPAPVKAVTSKPLPPKTVAAKAPAAKSPAAKVAPSKPAPVKAVPAKPAPDKAPVTTRTQPTMQVKNPASVAPPTKAAAPVAPARPPASSPVATATATAPARAGRPSSRLAQLTVPSMAQSVASTAAKASYTQSMPTPLISPPLAASIKKDPKLANNWKTKPLEQLTDADIMAMPDEAYMNEVQLAFFRAKLAGLKRDILSNAGETTEHLREDTVVVPDPADRATIEEEHALELRTRDRERKLLKKIEQSIMRIDAGDYGYCDETGEPIGVGRLLARPTATLSLEAQQRRELKQKMFGD